MWIYSFHRFETNGEYLDACAAAEIAVDDLGQPSDPRAVAADIIGELPDDPRWHVNMAWYDREVPEPFVASQITPITPRRVFAGAAP